MVKFITLLWHQDRPIGICVFVSPPISFSLRNQFFGRSGRWQRITLLALSRQLSLLQRVVLHPAYRGAGIASSFVHRSCRLCPTPWIETLTQMGHINPFFEKAGFQRVGVCTPHHRSRRSHSRIYGGNRTYAQETLVSSETFHKSRFSHPVYYVFDNRQESRQKESHGE
ncbi:MAG: hypothetical protein KDA66_08400 [Planctomycetaceae bacterium]|nr:hypothetical protein [Planctomycetaceae bacterium]